MQHHPNHHTAVLIEDSAEVRFLLALELEGRGIGIVGEGDRASSAIDLVARQRPDLVVLDHQLAGRRDGSWIVGRLRRAGFEGAIALVTGAGDLDGLRDAGADVVLPKSTGVRALGDTLCRLLDSPQVAAV